MLSSVAVFGVLAVLSSVSAGPVGSATKDSFPPSGTTVDTGLFPDRTVVGHAQATGTGVEAYAFATAPAAQFPKVQDSYGSVFLPKAKGEVSAR